MTQFNGESNWDAAINDYGLDIEQENAFHEFVKAKGYAKAAATGVLVDLIVEWQQEAGDLTD